MAERDYELADEYEAGYERGQEAERERIIDWLKSHAGLRAIDQGYKSSYIAQNVAKAIRDAS